MRVKKNAALTHDIRETGDIVVYDRTGNQLLLLNDMGAAVWILLDEARTTREIAELIVGTLPESPPAGVEAVEQDVCDFVETLRGHGLVELV